MKKYLPVEVENKWQRTWREQGVNKFSLDSSKEKFYNLVELPYPSGDLHIGHWFAFVPPDVMARFKRMQGLNVFFPNGFDAFGLPAENAAIKRGIHPKDWTMSNIETMTKQFQTMGTMIDWDHQAITCLPEYYKWNQWIFNRMFEKGIAYRGKTLSNWCPKDKTVLANEHVESGKCWRCGTEVIQKEVEQWFLKITAYADQLIWKEPPQADWPASVRDGQNNWIGKKTGINITYNIEGSDETVEVFTTRPDTNFGATFIALAPEHPKALAITTKDNKASVKAYLEKSKKKTELERKENKEKTGIFTGSYAINPLTNFKMPIWIADFVLINFGTGALVGVPGHDKTDFEFAQKFGLEIKRVVVGKDGDEGEIKDIKQVQEQEGKIVNSDFLNGLDIHPATKKIMDYMEEKGYGKREVEYHIHDWSISRQRYWGTPVPIIHCPNCGMIPVPDKDLPVELPYEVDFTPTGEPPLASNKEWLKVKCPKCQGEAKRDAETLDTFFDSSWYFLRYLDPHFDNGPFDPELAKILMPLDIYFGGSEHTLGHTLYARFFTKFFKDLKMVEYDEFAKVRVQHGVVLGPDGNRMSKSRGNVINPDDVVKEYGTDTVRLYLSFMMPYDATAPWSPGAISGIYRFLTRIWQLYDKMTKVELSKEDLTVMNQTIKKVTQEINEVKFNTAVAAIMSWLNHLSRKDKVSKNEYKNLILVLAPFAPHITEELWQRLGEKESIHLQSWPKVDEKYLQTEQVSIVIQVNGKVRDTINLSIDILNNQSDILKKALESTKVQKFLQGKEIKKTIYAKGKVLSLVV
ncbi:leucine--tRNA ligase [Candidatus Daviesbacteria bacterium]|nr:leucine--tRNA ligase [Candidatus Daviesbacteria bacterium]